MFCNFFLFFFLPTAPTERFLYSEKNIFPISKRKQKVVKNLITSTIQMFHVQSSTVLLIIVCFALVVILQSFYHKISENFEPKCTDSETIEPDQTNVNYPVYSPPPLETENQCTSSTSSPPLPTKKEEKPSKPISTPYPDLSRYILKSSIQPCNCPKQESHVPDPKHTVFAEAERSRYILKTEIPPVITQEHSCPPTVTSSPKQKEGRKRDSNINRTKLRNVVGSTYSSSPLPLSTQSSTFPTPLYNTNVQPFVLPSSDHTTSLRYLPLTDKVPDVYTQPDIDQTVFSSL